MEGIEFKNYTPDAGLEEIQAVIFNKANNRSVTAQEIKERFEREKIDPKTVIYAFNNNNEPIAYVQARDYPRFGEVHLGYPWMMQNGNIEIQKRMFSDLLSYLKQRPSDLKIRTSIPNDPEFHKFVISQGFSPERKVVRFDITLDSINKADLPPIEQTSYSLHLAGISDLEEAMKAYFKALGDLAQADSPELREIVSNCLKSSFTTLIKKEGVIAGVCCPRIPNPETENNQTDAPLTLGLQLFFTSIGEEAAIPYLMQSALETAISQNWQRGVIRINFTDENDNEMAQLRKIALEEKMVHQRYYFKED